MRHRLSNSIGAYLCLPAQHGTNINMSSQYRHQYLSLNSDTDLLNRINISILYASIIIDRHSDAF